MKAFMEKQIARFHCTQSCSNISGAHSYHSCSCQVYRGCLHGRRQRGRLGVEVQKFGSWRGQRQRRSPVRNHHSPTARHISFNFFFSEKEKNQQKPPIHQNMKNLSHVINWYKLKNRGISYTYMFPLQMNRSANHPTVLRASLPTKLDERILRRGPGLGLTSTVGCDFFSSWKVTGSENHNLSVYRIL